MSAAIDGKQLAYAAAKIAELPFRASARVTLWYARTGKLSNARIQMKSDFIRDLGLQRSA